MIIGAYYLNFEEDEELIFWGLLVWIIQNPAQGKITIEGRADKALKLNFLSLMNC